MDGLRDLASAAVKDNLFHCFSETLDWWIGITA
jgi:hypothetical protein